MGSADEPGSITRGISEERPDSAPVALAGDPVPPSRIRRLFSGSRDLWRVVYRAPEHLAERLTLYTADRLGDPSRERAHSARSARPDTLRQKIAEELRTHSAHVARIDGAISGTAFFFALGPGYLTHLSQEMRMTLRTAALYGRDPGGLRTSAEMLALRGVHPDVETAEAALNSVRDKGTPIVRHNGDHGAPVFTASTCCSSSAASCLSRSPSPIGEVIAVTISGRSRVRSRCFSLSSSRSRSLRTSITFATPLGSTGSVRSVRSSRCCW
jgi:hypothetical protein